MAIVSKQVLKSYFEQGDIPTEGQYYNLIDSSFNLADTDAQAIQGTLQVAVAEIDVLNLKKAYLPGIGISDAKIGSSFQIGKSLEVIGTASMDYLSVTGGSISASGGIVTSHITSSGTISGSKLSTTNQNFVRFYGSVQGSTTKHPNGMKVESGFVVGPALDIVGGISASGYINGRIHATNITSSGDISASGDIISADITASNIVLKGTSSAAEFALDRTDLLGGYPIDVIKYNDVQGKLTAGDAGPISYEIIGAGIVLDSSGDIILNADGGDVVFKDNLVNKINIQTTDGNITASGFIHSDSNISSSAGITGSDAYFSNTITVGGDYTSTNGDIQLTNGFISTDNMGPYMRDKITLLPTDFVLTNSAGDGQLQVTAGGASVKPSDSAHDYRYFASYVIPAGHSIRAMRIYSQGDVVTAALHQASIDDSSTSALCSGVLASDGEETDCTSSAGDGSRYLVVELDWTNTSKVFYGGYLLLGQ